MWSNFAPHKKCWWSCGTKLLHMTSYLAPHDTIVCHVEKLQMWINDTFFLLPNFAPHDKFTMYAVLSWFTLFWRKIHFVAIYALLCGANINPKILSVEQKWQIWCMGRNICEEILGEQYFLFHRYRLLWCVILVPNTSNTLGTGPQPKNKIYGRGQNERKWDR